MSDYISSIIFKYGDTDQVQKDVRTLNEITDRQGLSLLVDVIAERIGRSALKFNFSEVESNRLRDSLLNELREAINERI